MRPWRSLEDEFADARRELAAVSKKVAELRGHPDLKKACAGGLDPVGRLRNDFGMVAKSLDDADDALGSILTCAQDKILGR